MITQKISALVVFLQGMASFLSPCVLPLIPAYLTYLTGQSAEAMIRDPKAQKTLIWNGLAFVLGFTLVFVALGATASGLGRFLFKNSNLFRQISGWIIIFFGLFHMGIIPIPFLNYERRLQMTERAPGALSALLMGVGFSFGWTPCVGPVLSAVLMLAGRSATIWNGVFLLTLYSLGLGIPFILLAVFLKSLWRYLQGLYKYMRLIKIISGTVLVIVGILIVTDTLSYLATLGL